MSQPVSTPISKTCTVCGAVKALDEFYRHKRAPRNGRKEHNGFHGRCKACHYEQGKASVARNRDRINERKRLKRAAERKPKPIPQSLVSGVKTCKVCGVEKPIGEFYPDKKTRDRLKPSCKTCAAAVLAKWAAQNPERAKTREKAWKVNNRDKVNASGRASYRSNPALHMARTREWQKKNPERTRELMRAGALNYIARKAGAVGRYSAEDITRLREIQRGRCAYCDRLLDSSYHVDHMQPLSRGGSNWPENLHITCKSCNSSKGDKTHEEFVQYIGLI